MLAAAERIGDVYHRAFRVDEFEKTQRFLELALSRHVTYPEFRFVVAEAGDALVGFTYGYRSEPGRWWHDLIAPALRAHGKGTWIADAFEFVEFAVLPEMQKRGIGRHMHNLLLGPVRQSTALLSTDAPPNPAHDLYLRIGWIDLIPDFAYPGGGTQAAIMGLDLPAWRAANPPRRVELPE